jgi:outer membrane receptor for ferrienterochelin and colicins
MKSPMKICIILKKQIPYFIIIGALYFAYLPPVMCSDTTDIPVKGLFDVSLEELFDQTIVTATKSAQKLSETPATVRVITAQQIKQRGYMTLEELLSDISGIQFRNIQGFNSYVFIRGVPSQNNLILLLVDGVEINELNSGGFYGGGQFNLENVKKVEVVYGPASAMYGTNAMSGIINIITWDPDDKDAQGIWASATAGSFDTWTADFRTAYYDTEKQFGYSLSGTYKTTEKADLKGSEGDNNWTEEMDNFENDFAFDGKLKFRNSTFGFLYQDKESSRTTNYRTVNSDKVDYGTLWHITFMNLWLNNRYDIIDNLQLNSFLYYRDATVEDDTIAFIDKTGGPDPGQQVGYYRPNNQIGIEEQLNYRASDRLNIIGGIIWERERLSEDYSKTYSASQNQAPPTPGEPNKVTEQFTSIYVQSQYRFIEATELTLGFRWDDSTIYDSVIIPRGGLVYHGDKLTGKLLYSEAFRAPKPWDYNFGAGNSALEPETMRSYEGVIGYQFGADLHAEVSAYHNRIRDILTFNNDDNRWENQGVLTTNGLELTVDYTFKKLIAYVNYTFNDSEYENGDHVPEIARHNGNIGFTYALNRDWTFNLRGNYLGEKANPKTIAATGGNEIDSAFVVHGDVGWNYRGLDIHLIAKNLFDTVYYHPSNRPPERYRQPQRTILFKAQYRF